MATTARRDAKSVERLLRPRSIAIVGASATPGALGASVLANLDRLGYSGEVHLINPNRSEIAGRPCLKSTDELPFGVDAAVLAIPKAGVISAIAGLARRGVGAAVVFSAGFAEGGEAGRAEQREIARMATEHDMLIEGPNCLGFVNYVDGVALTFVESQPAPLRGRPGIAIVSQSGAMACVLGTMLASRDLGVSYSVSTGNEAVAGVEDFLGPLIDDSSTVVAGMIVEQFRRPQEFLALARHARESGKRIVLLHPGRSSAARQSAATHTGALAGDYALMRAKVEGEGVVFVESLEELGDTLEICARAPHAIHSLDRGTVVVTESGAFKALTLDLSEQVGLSLPTLDDRNAPALRAVMPDFVPVSNPLDLTAQGLVDPDLYRRTLEALAKDERLGAVVLGIIQTDAATVDRKLPAVIAGLRHFGSTKLVVFAGLDEGAPVSAQYLHDLRALGVPYFPSPDRAMRAIARLAAGAVHAPVAAPAPLTGEFPRVCGVIPEYQAKRLLAPLGFPFPKGRFVHTWDEARSAAESLGYPVALKAQSADLPHKSDAGGVVVGLADTVQLKSGWDRLHSQVARNRPELSLDGVLVECMGRPGVELIIGGRNDPDWGPVVLAGFGGIQAELLHDFCLILPGERPDAVRRALLGLKAGALFGGFRGTPELDLPALVDLIGRVGQLLVSHPAIRELDLNPVIAHPIGHGVLALDALILAN